MAEKLAQLKKKDGGSDKNLCFCYAGSTVPIYYDSEMFSLNGGTLTALKDLNITVKTWIEGYSNTSQWTNFTFTYGSQNFGDSYNQQTAYKVSTHDISIPAGTSISFAVSPYYNKANCMAYLTE